MDSRKQTSELSQVKLKPRPVVIKAVSSPQDEATKSKFPVLKSARRDNPIAEKASTELSQIKLKKARDWKVSLKCIE